MMSIQRILIILLCVFFSIQHGTEAKNCKDVQCPNIGNCKKTYLPDGECCRKCDCKSRDGDIVHGYFWNNNKHPCMMCSCDTDKGSEMCQPYSCPDQKPFKNCKKPLFNFFCGCIIGCEDAVPSEKPTHSTRYTYWPRSTRSNGTSSKHNISYRRTKPTKHRRYTKNTQPKRTTRRSKYRRSTRPTRTTRRSKYRRSTRPTRTTRRSKYRRSTRPTRTTRRSKYRRSTRPTRTTRRSKYRRSIRPTRTTRRSKYRRSTRPTRTTRRSKYRRSTRPTRTTRRSKYRRSTRPRRTTQRSKYRRSTRPTRHTRPTKPTYPTRPTRRTRSTRYRRSTKYTRETTTAKTSTPSPTTQIIVTKPTFTTVVVTFPPTVSCQGVKCPKISNCQKTVKLDGECCKRCDCKGRDKNEIHGYFFTNNKSACRICTCDVNNKEVCEPGYCPKQDIFKNCKQPMYNFYCGCKTGCNDVTTPRIFPTFPPFP